MQRLSKTKVRICIINCRWYGKGERGKGKKERQMKNEGDDHYFYYFHGDSSDEL